MVVIVANLALHIVSVLWFGFLCFVVISLGAINVAWVLKSKSADEERRMPLTNRHSRGFIFHIVGSFLHITVYGNNACISEPESTERIGRHRGMKRNVNGGRDGKREKAIGCRGRVARRVEGCLVLCTRIVS